MTIVLPARLTLANASTALAALQAQVAGAGRPVEVDASALEAFDTSAIATLLELRRQAAGRALRVSAAPPTRVELAGLYGVAELLGFDAAPADHSARA